MCKKSLLLLFLLPFQFVFAQTSLLTDFPEGYTPKEVGKRLAYHFVDGKHMLHIGKWISYPETFTWNGGLKFAALTNDQELVKLLQNRFELLFTTEKALLPIMNHVDVNMFGSLPLELYKITKDQRYLDWVFLMPILNGNSLQTPNRKKENGIGKVIPGRPVCGLTICT